MPPLNVDSSSPFLPVGTERDPEADSRPFCAACSKAVFHAETLAAKPSGLVVLRVEKSEYNDTRRVLL